MKIAFRLCLITLLFYITTSFSLCQTHQNANFILKYIKTVKLNDFPGQGGVIDTLRTGFFQEQNLNQSFWTKEYPIYSDFFSRGKEEEINIIKEHPSLIFKSWIKEKRSPLCIILPGLGGHYTSDTLTALAELFFDKGSSVVVLSSAMNWQFMSSAATVSVPGYPTQDAEDTYNAIKKIINRLIKENPNRFSEYILIGYSLGGLHTLLISQLNEKDSDVKIKFNKFIAINPPVDVCYSAKKLDEFYYVWWKYWEKDKIKNKVNKIVKAYMAMIKNKIPPTTKLPVSEREAKFLIGYFFRKKLSQIIYSLHKRNLIPGILHSESSWFTRRYLYKEINKIGFIDYMRKILIPFYYKKLNPKKHLPPLVPYSSIPKTFEKKLMFRANLRNISISYTQKQKITIIHTIDDFIISDEDKKWLADNYPNIIFFDRGGHLGELYSRKFQQRILKIISNLTDSDKKLIKK